MPVVYDFGSTQFDDAVRAATRKAFAETLGAGLPVFYIDGDGLNAMERADGRRFGIRWLPGAPSGENYEIIRELTAYAAQLTLGFSLPRHFSAAEAGNIGGWMGTLRGLRCRRCRTCVSSGAWRSRGPTENSPH